MQWAITLLFILIGCDTDVNHTPSIIQDTGTIESTSASAESRTAWPPLPPERSFSTQRIADWNDTGVAVLVAQPEDWQPTHGTVVLMHGANSHPVAYSCYGERFAQHGYRVLAPEMALETNWVGRVTRWQQVSQIATVLSAQSEPPPVYIGHSFGAYTTALTAGADSTVGDRTAGNCIEGECAPLPATGYIFLSGQPAQNAQNDPPYWFGADAYQDLAPGRFVVYGTADASPTDPCMQVSPPECRGDAYTVDSDPENVQIVVDGFEHKDFSCGEYWKTTERAPALNHLIDQMIRWVEYRREGEPVR